MRFVGFSPPWGDLVERSQDRTVKVGRAQGERKVCRSLAADSARGRLPSRPCCSAGWCSPCGCGRAAFYHTRCASGPGRSLPAHACALECVRAPPLALCPDHPPAPPSHPLTRSPNNVDKKILKPQWTVLRSQKRYLQALFAYVGPPSHMLWCAAGATPVTARRPCRHAGMQAATAHAQPLAARLACWPVRWRFLWLTPGPSRTPLTLSLALPATGTSSTRWR